MRAILGFIFALTILPAMAQARKVTVLDAAKFDAATAVPEQMDPGTLYYTQKVLTFAEWNQKAPAEAQALNLYQGFTEPEVVSIKYGIEKKVVEQMMVFVVRAKMILNKPPGQIGLINLTKLDSIRKFDPELKQTQIQPNQLLPAVAGKGQIDNFKWCSKDSIVRPAREKDLSFLTPKTRANWCSDTARSICVESCYLFNAGYNSAIALKNATVDENEKKDYGVAFQSEIRFFANEQEAGSPVPLAKLTGITSPVRGGIEQNSFYFNQLFQYAKILGVMQDHRDPAKTVASVYFVIGIKKRTWDSNNQVPVILMGESKYLNTATGITAGLPAFTQTTLNSIATIPEN
ncbi:MAG: hypothetical protein ACXVA9_09140 [Bdellovibrionales bacterium]